MRKHLPVQITVVVLAVGGLVSVSMPFGIGDIIISTPIILQNTAAQAIRAVADPPAKVMRADSARPSPANIAAADRAPGAQVITGLARTGQPLTDRNAEAVGLSRASMASAGVMVAATRQPSPRGRAQIAVSTGAVTGPAGPRRVTTQLRQTVIKPRIVSAVRQHRRGIEVRRRSDIPPAFERRRPHRPLFSPLRRQK